MSREPLVAAPEALGFGVPRALACGSCFGIVVERRASNQLRVQGLGFSTKRIRRARHQGRGPTSHRSYARVRVALKLRPVHPFLSCRG